MATKKKAGKSGSKGKGAAKGSKGKGKAKPKATSTKRKIKFLGEMGLTGTPITAGGE